MLPASVSTAQNFTVGRQIPAIWLIPASEGVAPARRGASIARGNAAVVQKVGKYELREVLGKGASGTVYHALDTFSGQDVALKLLDPEVVPDSDAGNAGLRQFLNEA
jgi:serine/threonine protein kinase